MVDRGALLEAIASKFNRAIHTQGEECGWGQFLDGPREHRQVGLYGTAAGLSVLCLANRADSPNANAARALLGRYWDARAEPGNARRFSQNMRLAVATLALRLHDRDADVLREVEDETIGRQLQGGGWGYWWRSEDHHDPSPRVSATALMILCLHACRSQGTDADLQESTQDSIDWLSERSKTSGTDLRILASTALLVAGGEHGKGQLFRATWSKLEFPSRMSPEFFEYEFLGANNERAFGQDYIMLPTNVLLALGGMQPSASRLHRLVAERLTSAIAVDLERWTVFKEANRARESSLNQLWVALLLAADGAGGQSPGLIHSAIYGLRRHRPDNWFFTIAAPVLTIVPAAIATALAATPMETAWAIVAASLAALFEGERLKELVGRLV